MRNLNGKKKKYEKQLRKEEELLKKFAPSFVETAKNFDQYLSVIPEAKIAREWSISAMHDITEGGVFGALWEMGSGSGVGLDIDLKKIPIRQETVEVCEALGLTPPDGYEAIAD